MPVRSCQGGDWESWCSPMAGMPASRHFFGWEWWACCSLRSRGPRRPMVTTWTSSRMMSAAPSLSPELRERLRRIAHVALDMDGTIYLGDKLFPETLPFLAALARLGIGHSFVTNNPS